MAKTKSSMITKHPQPQYHVQRAADIVLAEPVGPIAAHAVGLKLATLVGRGVGAVHTGLSMVELAPGAHVGIHLHSTEQSFYVLSGHPTLTVEAAPTSCRQMIADCFRSASNTAGATRTTSRRGCW